jgi:hypothetical protein
LASTVANSDVTAVALAPARTHPAEAGVAASATTPVATMAANIFVSIIDDPPFARSPERNYAPPAPAQKGRARNPQRFKR